MGNHMKHLVPLIVLLASAAAIAGDRTPPADRAPPLASGQYIFQHHFAEQPNLPSIPVVARIDGNHIVLVNASASDVFPKGVIAEGTLMWHAASKQWIIGNDPSDRTAKAVGSCSEGPEVVDLERLIYWTC